MGKFIDMTGWVMAEHGVPDSRLTVLSRCEDHIQKNGLHEIQWLCQCSCKDQTLIKTLGSSLRNGRTKSCGCLMRETTAELGRKSHKTNLYDLTGEYGIGYTESGEEFWFDIEDYDKIKDYHWRYDNHGYVSTDDFTNNHKRLLLHRLVMGLPDAKFDVDHRKHPPRNENKTDNRKANLAIVTHSKNLMNLSRRVDNKSGVTGVWWDESRQKWQAYICVNQKKIHLGRFADKANAVHARKEAEIKYFGENRYEAHNKKENLL